MPEDKRKINAWIPVTLYDKISTAGYENTTQAIINALQRLLEEPQEDITGYKEDIAAFTAENCQLKEDIAGYKRDLEKLNQDISGYKQDIRILETKTEEQEKLISFLTEALDKAGQREEDLKNMYNNYFVQVQTLINQKQIEAPGNKKQWWKFW